ncbi:MAG: T9SS type A sorting domain-containing protein, partial [Candidatus Latescibacterota bacterium]
NEGALYATWSLRHLVYYFWARQRFDGFDYSANTKIRNMERWLAYELLPEGGGHVNNIQDCSYLELPVSKHTTYFDWTQTAWGSDLSAYIWEHVAGTYGHNAGTDADKAATAIWHQNLTPVQPGSILPPSMLWENRGLYYFRTGWPSAASSDDVVFSFYSGPFQGGHAQADQNQFTLYGYGGTWAMDHGPGQDPITSDAHNMIFIDGDGQHRAGNSIGTDGHIRQYLLNDYADIMVGDATQAYTTHSPVNNRGFPFPESDWSWGFGGENPVEHACRTVIVVRDPSTPPYFIILDDIDKDGLTHTYEWRMHTARDNIIDTTSNPISITRGGSFLNIHVLDPPFSSLQKSVTFFNNRMPDPDSNILSLSASAVNARFCFLLLPGDGTVTPPAVTRTIEPWGSSITVAWTNGETDVLLINESNEMLSYSAGKQSDSSIDHRSGDAGADERTSPFDVPVTTDADLAMLRFDEATLTRYVLTNTTFFVADGINHVSINNGPATIGFSESEINIDRYDADFSIYAPGVTDMFYRNQRIHVVENDGYLTRDPVTGVIDGAPRQVPIAARAYPNPFNPTTTIAIELSRPANVAVAIFDAKGRRVKTLWAGPLGAGTHRLEWSGRNESGHVVASGVYLAMITSGRDTRALKLVVVK